MIRSRTCSLLRTVRSSRSVPTADSPPTSAPTHGSGCSSRRPWGSGTAGSPDKDVTLSDDLSRHDAATGAPAAPPPVPVPAPVMPSPPAAKVRQPAWQAPKPALIALAVLVLILAGVVIWLWLLV